MNDHNRNLILVHRVRDEDDDEEQFKPLDWRLIRRLLGYARPVRRKLAVMVVLTVIRSAQLPALVWITAVVI
jgi:ATP-binding cassette subfamily B protein